jgi:hypothetical protein
MNSWYYVGRGIFFGLGGANKWFHSLRVFISVAIINYYASLGDKRTNKTQDLHFVAAV